MNVPLFVILLLIVESFDISLGLGVSENIVCGSSIPTYVCLPRNYSSMDIPLMDEPNHINIEIHISDVLKINDRDFSITFSLYFNVQWREPRLQIDSSFFQNRYLKCIIIHKNELNILDYYFFHLIFRSSEEDQLQPVDLNLINDLWVPNVFIYNLKTFKVSKFFHEINFTKFFVKMISRKNSLLCLALLFILRMEKNVFVIHIRMNARVCNSKTYRYFPYVIAIFRRYFTPVLY